MNSILLIDACNIVTGKLDSNAAIDDGKYPFFTCAPEPLRINSYEYDDDVILLAGNNAQGNFHIQRYNGKFNAYQRTYIITAKKGFDIDFIKYSLEMYLEHFKKIAQGSQTKFLTMKILEGFKINNKSLYEQKKTIEVIKSIDKKIENNNKINDNLYHQLRTLYNYWFIQFDFPNNDGKAYFLSGGEMVYNEQVKRKIPVGWEVKQVKEIAPVITGKEDANFSSKNGDYKFFTCSNEPLQCDIYAFEGQTVLVAGNGDFNVKHFTGKFNAYQRTYVLIPFDLTLYANLYMVATSYIDQFKNGSNGSIVKFITKGDIENMYILIPTDKMLLERLNKILNMIENNKLESEKLISLRDWLLPMLMNGQATID